ELVWLAKALPWVRLPVHRKIRIRNSPEEAQSRALRLAVAVLDLGAECDPYLAGRGRQAVRTNSSRAVRFGAKAVELESEAERFEAFDEILRAREPENDTGWSWLDQLTKSGTSRCFGAFAADGTPLAVSSADCHFTWASMRWFLRHPGRAEGDDARYLLHTAMVETLCDGGVRYLISDSALRMSTGLRYLHHLLGYRPMNVRYRGKPVKAGGR
ncbi:MAG: hypothetical protein WAM97_03445, partial [Acidimicrobiales bacterium]